MFLKRSWVYFLIIIFCIAGYFVSKSVISKRLIEKQITYTSSTASVVYMAWGFSSGSVPSSNVWPKYSFEKDGMIYTPLASRNKTFFTSLKLKAGTEIYYWMVQKKDTSGNETDIWDAGGQYKKQFRLTFSDDGFFRPGYFIFLAGFLPLLIYYLRNRKIQNRGPSGKIFTVKDYIPQFDSIRAIAVLMVIIHHWYSKNRVLNFLANGPMGVNIFFVLSGFLITGILLKAKQQVDEKRLKRAEIFKNFYIRRTLRIFPIYYLFLIIFLILKDSGIKEHSIWYFTYTSNILFYSQQFFADHFAHLWSLAVEEQFYIFWPWLIILVNKKYLPYLFSFFLIVGISSNYIFIDKGWWVQIFTPACFDAFAIGGFLSYLNIYRQDIIQLIQPNYKLFFVLILLVFIGSVFNYSFLPGRTIDALLGIAIIYYCLFKGNNKIMNFVLDNKWLMGLGKISYGIYLYHLVIPQFWGWVIQKFASWNIDLFYNKAMPALLKPVWLFFQEFSLLILICFLSWRLIEKPINNLKKYFENKPREKKSDIEKADSRSFIY